MNTNSIPDISELMSEFARLVEGKNEKRQNDIFSLIELPLNVRANIRSLSAMSQEREIYEWWTQNICSFLREIWLVYAILTIDNPDWRNIYSEFAFDTSSGYPSGVQYFWFSANTRKPEVLPVKYYMEHILLWCESRVQNEDIFPSNRDIPFPFNFVKFVGKIFSRLSRIFYIVCANQCLLSRLQNNSSLKLCMRHFFYFGWKWNILDLATKQEMGECFELHKDFVREKQLLFFV